MGVILKTIARGIVHHSDTILVDMSLIMTFIGIFLLWVGVITILTVAISAAGFGIWGTHDHNFDKITHLLSPSNVDPQQVPNEEMGYDSTDSDNGSCGTNPMYDGEQCELDEHIAGRQSILVQRRVILESSVD